MGNDNGKSSRLPAVAITATVLVIVLWLVNLILVPWLLENPTMGGGLKDLTRAGHFGDMFGAANSLFSGLALIGVVWAIILQHIELKKLNSTLDIEREKLHIEKERFAIATDPRFVWGEIQCPKAGECNLTFVNAGMPALHFCVDCDKLEYFGITSKHRPEAKIGNLSEFSFGLKNKEDDSLPDTVEFRTSYTKINGEGVFDTWEVKKSGRPQLLKSEPAPS